MNKKIIAVFGGSFNPPINSHILLAEQILKEFKNIEKLIFVPVSTKYKKLELADNEHRYNMLKLICCNEDKIEVSDIELKAKRQLYTIETLDLLKKRYGDEYEVYFIMGTDNLKEIETWRKPERLLRDYKIIAIERNNDKLEDIINEINILKENEESIIKLKNIEKINLSSAEVRKKIKNGEDIKGYVPEGINKYIYENKLYK